jgi:uncharacterized protein (DUF433 family)
LYIKAREADSQTEDKRQEVMDMTRIRWQERVVIAPDVHHGDACIKGTRIPVTTIVGSLADGMTSEEIRAAYPQLTSEDIQAALAYAADVIHQEILVPPGVEE